MSFESIYYHRLKYFLTPQLDLYKNIRTLFRRNHPAPVKILDYGCGTGIGSVVLGGDACFVKAIDSDPSVIDFAAEIFGHLVSFQVGDWAQDSDGLESNFYNLVTCIEVIEHIQKPENLLEKFALITTPGSFVVVSTLNHNSQYRKNSDHIAMYKVAGFRALIQSHLPGALITDYTLKAELYDDSTITPMVAVWRKPK